MGLYCVGMFNTPGFTVFAQCAGFLRNGFGISFYGVLVFRIEPFCFCVVVELSSLMLLCLFDRRLTQGADAAYEKRNSS